MKSNRNYYLQLKEFIKKYFPELYKKIYEQR